MGKTTIEARVIAIKPVYEDHTSKKPDYYLLRVQRFDKDILTTDQKELDIFVKDQVFLDNETITALTLGSRARFTIVPKISLFDVVFNEGRCSDRTFDKSYQGNYQYCLEINPVEELEERLEKKDDLPVLPADYVWSHPANNPTGIFVFRGYFYNKEKNAYTLTDIVRTKDQKRGITLELSGKHRNDQTLTDDLLLDDSIVDTFGGIPGVLLQHIVGYEAILTIPSTILKQEKVVSTTKTLQTIDDYSRTTTKDLTSLITSLQDTVTTVTLDLPFSPRQYDVQEYLRALALMFKHDLRKGKPILEAYNNLLGSIRMLTHYNYSDE